MRSTTQARRIEVQIQNDERRLRLWVQNDGKGVDSGFYNRGCTRHWGLEAIDERAKLVGGQLEIWSQLDSGTEIELRIPASIAYLVSAAHQSRKKEPTITPGWSRTFESPAKDQYACISRSPDHAAGQAFPAEYKPIRRTTEPFRHLTDISPDKRAVCVRT